MNTLGIKKNLDIYGATIDGIERKTFRLIAQQLDTGHMVFDIYPYIHIGNDHRLLDLSLFTRMDKPGDTEKFNATCDMLTNTFQGGYDNDDTFTVSTTDIDIDMINCITVIDQIAHLTNPVMHIVTARTTQEIDKLTINEYILYFKDLKFPNIGDNGTCDILYRTIHLDRDRHSTNIQDLINYSFALAKDIKMIDTSSDKTEK